MASVSVIIPTYNCAQYITEAIDSVLSQTYRDFEIIVVDDGSTDNTKEVLSNYISSKTVRYYYQENRGVAAARNKGINEAKGELIAFLDADDKWLPQRLEKSTEFLKNHDFDWVCSAFYRRVRETGETEIKRLDKTSLFGTGYNINILKEGLPYSSEINIWTGTVLVKRKSVKQVGYFDECFQSCEDWDMWLRYEEAGLKGGYLDMPLACYMKTNNSLTTASKYKLINSDLMVTIKHANILGLKNKKIRNSLGIFYFKKADIYFNEHNAYMNAFYFAMKGFYYYPSIKKILKGLRVILKQINPRFRDLQGY